MKPQFGARASATENPGVGSPRCQCFPGRSSSKRPMIPPAIRPEPGIGVMVPPGGGGPGISAVNHRATRRIRPTSVYASIGASFPDDASALAFVLGAIAARLSGKRAHSPSRLYSS